ncbi:MAG: 16S rRNA (uracil(1498)-N(3))-methyltransferase [Bacteroidota bacterium]
MFYTHTIVGDVAYFDEIELRHCIQVLRKKPGDEILFTDGAGSIYNGRIISAGKKEFLAQIMSSEEQKKELTNDLHVAIAPTKNIDRFEWFLEKATEMGIAEITPVICKNSERRRIRPERLEKILLSAMKQSFRSFLPTLNPLVQYEEFIRSIETGTELDRFIAHCHADNLPHLFHNSQSNKSVLVMIGPEGDFDLQEIEMARKSGFVPVSLGPSRLRTETAGIAAVHIINLKNQLGT